MKEWLDLAGSAHRIRNSEREQLVRAKLGLAHIQWGSTQDERLQLEEARLVGEHSGRLGGDHTGFNTFKILVLHKILERTTYHMGQVPEMFKSQGSMHSG